VGAENESRRGEDSGQKGKSGGGHKMIGIIGFSRRVVERIFWHMLADPSTDIATGR